VKIISVLVLRCSYSSHQFFISFSRRSQSVDRRFIVLLFIASRWEPLIDTLGAIVRRSSGGLIENIAQSPLHIKVYIVNAAKQQAVAPWDVAGGTTGWVHQIRLYDTLARIV